MGMDRGSAQDGQGLTISRWSLMRPLDAQFGVAAKRNIPDELFGRLFDSSALHPHHVYALLDGAKVAGLADMLRASGAEHRCIFKGKLATELREVAPWIVHLTPDARLTRSLFTTGRMPGALWDRQPGVFLRSRASLDDIWQYMRKFTRLQDQNGGWFYLRFWDPACFDLTADLIQRMDAGIRRGPGHPVEMILIQSAEQTPGIFRGALA